LFYCNATFYNEAEAFEHLQKVNVKEGLDIKNKFTVFEDKVVVSLPNGYFKCDIDDINIVENHLWSSNRKGYIAARINGKIRPFHNVITNNNRPLHINTEFIDKNPLNCPKSNLCLVDKRVINITCQMQRNNTSGTVGVHYNCHHRNWNATWKDEQGDKHTKSFSVIKYGPACMKELAIQYRAYIERYLPHYAIVLGINE